MRGTLETRSGDLGVTTSERTMEVGAVSWRLREAGAGQPLLLLHGGGVDTGDITYGAALTALGRRRRVIVPDLPGFGGTPLDDRTATIEAYVDAVIGAIDALRAEGLGQLDVGGLSLGGGIALGVALRRPSWLRKLVLIAPYGLTHRIPYQWITRFMVRHPGLSVRLGNLAVSRPSWTRRTLRTLLTNSDALTPAIVEAVMAEGRRSEAGTAWQRIQTSEVTAHGLRTCYVDRLASVEVPTLILCGARDKLVPAGDCERAAELIPHSRVRVFDRSSHWLPRDEPERFAAEVDAFLEEP